MARGMLVAFLALLGSSLGARVMHSGTGGLRRGDSELLEPKLEYQVTLRTYPIVGFWPLLKRVVHSEVHLCETADPTKCRIFGFGTHGALAFADEEETERALLFGVERTTSTPHVMPGTVGLTDTELTTLLQQMYVCGNWMPNQFLFFLHNSNIFSQAFLMALGYKWEQFPPDIRVGAESQVAWNGKNVAHWSVQAKQCAGRQCFEREAVGAAQPGNCLRRCAWQESEFIVEQLVDAAPPTPLFEGDRVGACVDGEGQDAVAPDNFKAFACEKAMGAIGLKDVDDLRNFLSTMVAQSPDPCRKNPFGEDCKNKRCLDRVDEGFQAVKSACEEGLHAGDLHETLLHASDLDCQSAFWNAGLKRHIFIG